MGGARFEGPKPPSTKPPTGASRENLLAPRRGGGKKKVKESLQSRARVFNPTLSLGHSHTTRSWDFFTKKMSLVHKLA